LLNRTSYERDPTLRVSVISLRDRFPNLRSSYGPFPPISTDKEMGNAGGSRAYVPHCTQFDGLDIAILLFAERSVR